MNEGIYTEVKGKLKVWTIDRDGNKTISYDGPNTVISNGKNIIARCLGGAANWPLQFVRALKATVLLSDCTSMTITYPAVDKVQFNARFNEASFNDTLDELQLHSPSGGIFSDVTGLSVFKDNTLQVEVEWILTVVTI